MPRFASGFISFLALQSFKSYATNMMPNGGMINGISWIDVFLSVSGILMGMSVIQTITSHYVNANFSLQVCVVMDMTARWMFPLVFILVIFIMILASDVTVASAIVHIVVVVFMIGYYLFVWYQIRYNAELLFKRAVVMCKSGAKRYSGLHLTDVEVERLFDKLDKKANGKLQGRLEVRQFQSAICSITPSLHGHEEALGTIFNKHFGEGTASVYFPEFRKAICNVITDLTLELNPDVKLDDSVERMITERCMQEERLYVSTPDGPRPVIDLEDDDEDDADPGAYAESNPADGLPEKPGPTEVLEVRPVSVLAKDAYLPSVTVHRQDKSKSSL